MAALIIAIFPQNSSRGNWEEQQDRTDPNSQFELARKPAWLLAFRQFGLPKWKHDFECCKTLADSRLEQVVSGHFVKRQKRRRRKGLRTFRPVSAGGDSNRPKVQIKPRSCVNSPRSCAFARSQARKQRPQQRR